MLLARPDEEKRSRRTEIGHGPVDPKRINHFEVHFDVRFEQVSGLPSSCALGAFGLRKPYRDVFRCEL